MCGGCCGREPGTVSVTASELSALAASLGVSEDEFTRFYTWRKYGALSIREEPNYDCALLSRLASGPKCGVYSVRPAQCATFPFWPDVLKSKYSWDDYASSCPGMNSGAFHDGEEILQTLEKYSRDTVANFLK
jgi:Fe-S-cluster containining protein